MNIEKFKELLSVPSKTYQEEDMVEYICDELEKIQGVSYYRDSMMNIYVTKGTLEKGEYYPMFIAHTDTVHSKVDKIVVKEEKLQRPYTFGKTFDNTEVDVLKAYDKYDNPTGIGGDDKCGIFICLELLKQLDKVKVGSEKMPNLSKPIIFDPMIDVTFDVGAHHSSSNKSVYSNSDEIKILHYKFLGKEYVADIYKQRLERLSELNKTRQWGIHYSEINKVHNMMDEILNNNNNVIQ